MSQDGYEADRECGYGARTRASEVDRLRAELDSERERAQELAGQLDRERFLRREAEAHYLAVAEASGAVHHQSMGPAIPGTVCEIVDAFQRETIAAIEDRDHAIALFTLVYSMREHALRGRIAESEADYYAIAEALGIMYEGDGFARVPGPLDAVLRRIDELKAAQDREIDRALVEINNAGPMPATATFAPWKVGDACEVQRCGEWVRATVVRVDLPYWIDVEFVDGARRAIDMIHDGLAVMPRRLPAEAWECARGPVSIHMVNSPHCVRRPERHARVVYGPLPEHPPEDGRPIPAEAMEPREGGGRTPEDCGGCEGNGWNWDYTPEHGIGDTKITCHECEGSGKQRIQEDEPTAFTSDTRPISPWLADDIRAALACQPGHELEAIAALMAAKDAYRDQCAQWRKATGHDDAEYLDFVLGRSGIDAHLRVAYELRDAAIARAEKAEAFSASLNDGLDRTINRAKSAEATIARVRAICTRDYDAAYDLTRDVLAEIGEGSDS